jgi:NDP-sugar pyrophosphorylase family protein
MSTQQAVILCGGLGTRLRPITEKIPKALVEVHDKPFLQWQLEYLADHGIEKVVLLCSYLGEQIEKQFGNEFDGMDIVYSYEKPEPLGTGGALRNALKHLDEVFWLFNGDSFLEIDMETMWFSAQHFDACVSAFRNVDQSPVIPNLKVANMIGNSAPVNAYKKNGGLENGFNAIDSGVYVIKRSVVEKSKSMGVKFQVEDMWPELIAEKKLGAYFEKRNFYDIGTPERLKIFEDWLRDNF